MTENHCSEDLANQAKVYLESQQWTSTNFRVAAKFAHPQQHHKRHHWSEENQENRANKVRTPDGQQKPALKKQRTLT